MRNLVCLERNDKLAESAPPLMVHDDLQTLTFVQSVAVRIKQPIKIFPGLLFSKGKR